VLEVHVVPLEAQEFTLAHARLDSEHKEASKRSPLTASSNALTFDGEGEGFFLRSFGDFGGLGDAAERQVPFDGPPECLVQGDMDVVHRTGRQPGVKPIAAEVLDVSGTEFTELLRPEDGLYVKAHHLLVAFECPPLDGTADRVREPAIEVFPERQILIGQEESGVAIRHGLSQLRCRLRLTDFFDRCRLYTRYGSCMGEVSERSRTEGALRWHDFRS
jgi:hypothetical protein